MDELNNGGYNMKIMSPKVDFVFKRIFGSEKNKHLLISFLNAVFDGRHPKIIAVELKNTDNEKDSVEDKFSRLDIKAVTETGKMINIEIQRQDNHDMVLRSLYYAATMIHEQLDGKVETPGGTSKYKNYKELKPVVSINIVDFICTESKNFHSYANLTQSEGILLTDLLEIHFFELPKFKEQVKTAKNLLECWLEFINAEEDETILPTEKNFPEIQEASEELQRISLDKEARALYNKRQETLRNEYIALSTAHEDGVKQGIEQGIEQGIVQGIVQGEIKTVQRLLKAGQTKEFILDTLGIPPEVYEKAILPEEKKYDES